MLVLTTACLEISYIRPIHIANNRAKPKNTMVPVTVYCSVYVNPSASE